MSGKSGLKFFFLLSVAVLFNAFLIGCTSQTQVAASGTPTPIPSEPTDGKQMPIITSSPVPEMVVSPQASTKTGEEIIDDTIAQAVADGEYSEDVTYAYHSGQETVKIQVTVKDDVITEASVAPDENAANVSIKIIGNFNNALPELVVGKKITELEIPKNVAGSSLTTAAFKGYLEKLIETK